MLNLGLIGCGRIVEFAHVDAFKKLSDKVKVVAISDASEARLKAVGDMLSIDNKNRYTDYRQMIEKHKMDFVDIAVPPFLHEQIFIDCVNAKINILIEKPIAMNLEQVDNMLGCAEKNKVMVSVFHNYRHSLSLIKLRQLLETG